MPAHRNDDLANKMRALYLDGASLAEVADHFNRTRQGVFKMFVRRGWEMRAIRPDLQEHDCGPARIEWQGHTYTSRNCGYYRKTEGDRELLHRAVWKFHRGPIPQGFEVNHIDHNKANNDITNLELLSKSEHAKETYRWRASQ